MKISRRDFIQTGLGASLGIMVHCSGGQKAKWTDKKVIVLGIDGMDPVLLENFMRAHRMPQFSRLIRAGGDFKTMETTIPAQSPVAWASFITAKNPGQYGIFDFIHREPENFPAGLYLSTSKTIEPNNGKMRLGKWMIPYKSAVVKNMVGANPFWNEICDVGLPAIIYRVPADFPPFSGKAWQFSGMGTPDLLGTYGTFSYYTDNPPENAKEVTGGEVYPTFLKNGVAENFIYGPKNSFRLTEDDEYEDLKIPFMVYVDERNPVAKILIQGKEILLNVGEWSGWVELKFELISKVKSIYGMVKFYLKEVKPDFKFYVSPVNINPGKPALPIFNPENYGKKLANELGLFYTQGMAEDTKARTYNVLDDKEYWNQSQMVTRDWLSAWKWHLKNFRAGFLFFYFSTLDLGQHMFFRFIDEKNPLHKEALKSGLENPIERLYKQMDNALGLVLNQMDEETTLIVISDHGFAGFNRAFNLNSWLLDNGYLYLIDPDLREQSEYFENVDWGRSRAYGLGINGLYLNLAGREATGILRKEEAESLLKELKEKLEAIKDPLTGEHPIKNAYIAGEVYKGKFVGTVSPDIVIGYRRGFRASWETTLGRFPKEWLVDNLDPWSGDHCIDPTEVPAILVCNKKIKKTNPGIWDIGPTVLREFGIKIPKDFEGEPVF